MGTFKTLLILGRRGNRVVTGSSFHYTFINNLSATTRNSFLATNVTRTRATDSEVQQKIKEFREGDYGTIPDPQNLQHFRSTASTPKQSVQTLSPQSSENVNLEKQEVDLQGIQDTNTSVLGGWNLPHPIWSEEDLQSVEITHKPPEGIVEHMAYYAVQSLRTGFDVFSGYNRTIRTEKIWIRRIIFLETVAGVPGMVAAMVRHLKSLGLMRRDFGWIHTLLEEAENERMHLMTALQLKQPSLFFRLCVLGAQGVFVSMFSACYMISPRFCHRFVGYLEEEAVKTYTKCLQDIEKGPMTHWKTTKAPLLAVEYWKLEPNATMKDVILAIRADEAHHRIVNHTLASLKQDDVNPYKPGQ